MSTVADSCSAPLVGHRSSVIRVLQTRVVATQENICGTGVNGKKTRLFIGQGGLPKSVRPYSGQFVFKCDL